VAPWLIRMRWLGLLFAHWPIEPDAVTATLPADLELDTFDGTPWLAVVPFVMAGVAPRGLPAPGRFGTFPQLNVRTYVRRRDRPEDRGIWFLSLDARSRPTVLGARVVFHLPYVRARMTARRDGAAISFSSERDDPGWPPVRFEARYQPTGEPATAAPGSFAHWATERRRQFAADGRGRLVPSDVEHAPWPLQPAEAVLDATQLTASHGINVTGPPEHLHFVRRLDVRGFPPVRS
jgi:uncharacterized protein YqjF (DUF2071 family)